MPSDAAGPDRSSMPRDEAGPDRLINEIAAFAVSGEKARGSPGPPGMGAALPDPEAFCAFVLATNQSTTQQATNTAGYPTRVLVWQPARTPAEGED